LTCKTNGSGTVCNARLTTTYSFAAEFTCTEPSTFDVNEAGTTEREVVWEYDRAGNLASRTTRIISLAGSFSNAATGKSVPESGHFTIRHEYLTPGDLSTDQTTFDGLFVKVTVPGEGIVFQDAGSLVYDPGGDVLHEGGHHQFQASELAGLCNALA